MLPASSTAISVGWTRKLLSPGALLLQQIKQSGALRAAEDRARQLAVPPPVTPAHPLAEALPEAQDWRAKLGLG